MSVPRLPRLVRFLCQQCGGWTTYWKTGRGVDRYVCDDCVGERTRMLENYRNAHNRRASNNHLTKGGQ